MTKRWGWIFVLVLLVPLEARANVPTPLMWLTMFQLFVGNALIGIGEGWLLIRVFKLRSAWAVGWMILANYVSAWCGLFLIGAVEERTAKAFLGDQPLYRAGTLVAIAFGALFALTVLIEWPFVAFALKGRPRFVLKALPASLLVQTASYLVLAPLFYAASATGLFTDIKRDASVVQQANPAIVVYYIGASGRDVFRVPLAAGVPVRVGTVPESIPHPILTPRLDAEAERWDLVVEDENRPQEETSTTIISGIASAVYPSEAFLKGSLPHEHLYPDHRPPLDCAKGSDWRIRYPRSYDWARPGLTFWNERTGSEYRAAAETLALSWAARGATRLPSDQVLFGFIGLTPQVVVLDMPSRRIGLVALGRSPVATIDGAIPVWQPGPEGTSVASCDE